MFFKSVDEMRQAGKETTTANGQARTIRMLTEADGVGFGFSHVCLAAGAETSLGYEHDWQANHIISGTLEVTDITTGQTWELGPSMAYNVGPEDRHRIRARTDVMFVSVFCPAAYG